MSANCTWSQPPLELSTMTCLFYLCALAKVLLRPLQDTFVPTTYTQVKSPGPSTRYLTRANRGMKPGHPTPGLISAGLTVGPAWLLMMPGEFYTCPLALRLSIFGAATALARTFTRIV